MNTNLKKSELLTVLGALEFGMFHGDGKTGICGWRQGNTIDSEDEGKIFVPGMPVSNRVVVELDSGQMLLLTVEVMPEQGVYGSFPATVLVEDDMPGQLEEDMPSYAMEPALV